MATSNQTNILVLSNLTKNSPSFKKITLSNAENNFLEEINKKLKNNDYVGNIFWPENQVSINKEIVSAIYDKLWENNLKYERFPNYFIHGLLSKHVYINSSKDDIVMFKDDIKYNDGLKDWCVHKISQSTNGYYGAIYLNEKTNQIVLAHRGTELSLKDIETDIIGVFNNQKTDQQIECFKLADVAIELAKEKCYSLSITGHSLGVFITL